MRLLPFIEPNRLLASFFGGGLGGMIAGGACFFPAYRRLLDGRVDWWPLIPASLFGLLVAASFGGVIGVAISSVDSLVEKVVKRPKRPTLTELFIMTSLASFVTIWFCATSVMIPP